MGSNLGDSRQTLLAALEEMKQLPGYTELARSACWQSAPLGGPLQPDYYNAAVEAAYTGAPLELLEALQAIEERHQRRREIKNGPRTLDLDILLFNGEIINHSRLMVPHPRLGERAFALLPLMQLNPDLIVPGRKMRVSQLYRALQPEQRIEQVSWVTSGAL